MGVAGDPHVPCIPFQGNSIGSVRESPPLSEGRHGLRRNLQNGAEDADYAAAGLAYGAKDAPFAMTEELLQVPGMTRELFDRVAPDITVYSPRFAAGA